MQLRWSHAVVYVKDMDAMLDFYTHVLGFDISDRGWEREDGTPGIVFLSQVDSDHHQLGFAPTREEVSPSNSVSHVAFRVADLADVKAMIAKLKQDGRATDLKPLCHGNAWSIYFQDPEQNGVEIFCDTPFHVAQPQAKPWDPNASEEEILEWTEQTFRDEPEFGPIDAYYAKRREELANR